MSQLDWTYLCLEGGVAVTLVLVTGILVSCWLRLMRRGAFLGGLLGCLAGLATVALCLLAGSTNRALAGQLPPGLTILGAMLGEALSSDRSKRRRPSRRVDFPT